jgi:hypothetical protein
MITVIEYLHEYKSVFDTPSVQESGDPGVGFAGKLKVKNLMAGFL